MIELLSMTFARIRPTSSTAKTHSPIVESWVRSCIPAVFLAYVAVFPTILMNEYHILIKR